MNQTRGIVGMLGLLTLASAGSAQVPPFFFPGGTAFEPQIGIVQAGVVQDVQAVVSADRKYVTLNMRAQNTNLLALQPFTFQQGPALGVVGLPPPAPATPRGTKQRASAAAADPMSLSPDEIKRRADSWVLERQGMFRVAAAD